MLIDVSYGQMSSILAQRDINWSHLWTYILAYSSIGWTRLAYFYIGLYNHSGNLRGVWYALTFPERSGCVSMCSAVYSSRTDTPQPCTLQHFPAPLFYQYLQNSSHWAHKEHSPAGLGWTRLSQPTVINTTHLLLPHLLHVLLSQKGGSSRVLA